MKGGKRENAGRKKGSKGRRVLEWEQFGKQLLGNINLQRALEIMRSADDDDFMKYFNTLAEYFKPKLSRGEIENKGDLSIIIKRQILDNGNKPESNLHSTTE